MHYVITALVFLLPSLSEGSELRCNEFFVEATEEISGSAVPATTLDANGCIAESDIGVLLNHFGGSPSQLGRTSDLDCSYSRRGCRNNGECCTQKCAWAISYTSIYTACLGACLGTRFIGCAPGKLGEGGRIIDRPLIEY